MSNLKLSAAYPELRLRRVLIIEETVRPGAASSGNLGPSRLFLNRLGSKEGNSLTPLDDSIVQDVHKLHVIYPSVCQFYCAKHLESNPHYTVRDGEELNQLVRKAVANGILLHYYHSDKDHLDSSCVRVLNNLHLAEHHRQISQIPWSALLNTMNNAKFLDERRGSFTSHVGFSTTLGQGWHNPYPDLDRYAGEMGLCKPGITSSMPALLVQAMGPALSCCSKLSQSCWGCDSIYPDIDRKSEFADILGKHLQCSSDVLFEAGTVGVFVGDTQQLAVHVDVLNDSTPGYETTAVLSMYLVDQNGQRNRITIIGYNRKCCRDFMIRLNAARDKQQKALTIDSVFHTLDIRKQRQLRVIEAAACLWISSRGAEEKIQKHWERMYTEDELSEAGAVVAVVIRSGVKATQEERPQIRCVKHCVNTMYPSVTEVLRHLGAICRALTFVIHTHSKNHQLDGINLIQNIRDRDTFQTMFATYSNTMMLLPQAATEYTWVDVYGEYTFNKLFSTLNHKICDDRLSKFVVNMRPRMCVEEVVRLLSKHKVFILGGKLFQILTIVLLKEIGLIVVDESYWMYLPRIFTKTSGSVKLLQTQAGFSDPYVCKEYIRQFAKRVGMYAITYENILCKLHVAYYNRRRNRIGNL